MTKENVKIKENKLVPKVNISLCSKLYLLDPGR
jgi:hypothetical protein